MVSANLVPMGDEEFDVVVSAIFGCCDEEEDDDEDGDADEEVCC